MGDTEDQEVIDDELVQDSSHISISHYPTVFNQQDDVDELKNRISQLEHLVISSTLNASAFLDPSTTRLSPHALMQRVSHLEGLLAASELDNQRLEHEVELLKAANLEAEVDAYRKIRDRDAHIKNLEQDMELLSVRLNKAGTTMSSMEEYIHSLPSQQELDDVNRTLCKAHLDNDILQNNVERLENSLAESQKALAEKSTLYSQVLQRLEELQPIEEAQQSILGDMENEPNLLELATIQKTQLLKATKIIKAQRRSVCDLETERSELLLQLTEKGNVISGLDANKTAIQYKLENTLKQLKAAEDINCQLMTQLQELQVRLDSSENWIRVRKTEMSNLLRLVTEVEFTVSDLKKLVTVCQNLSLGDEPSLEDMLCLEFEDGGSEGDNDRDESEIEIAEIDLEWILERLKLVREASGSIRALRRQVVEVYTDILGSGRRGCDIQ